MFFLCFSPSSLLSRFSRCHEPMNPKGLAVPWPPCPGTDKGSVFMFGRVVGPLITTLSGPCPLLGRAVFPETGFGFLRL